MEGESSITCTLLRFGTGTGHVLARLDRIWAIWAILRRGDKMRGRSWYQDIQSIPHNWRMPAGELRTREAVIFRLARAEDRPGCGGGGRVN
jgi:hypothetical protein